MLMRTASARRVGPVIDPAHGRGDMVDWIARARELGMRLEMMPEVLALRRIIPGSLSYGRDGRDYGYLQTVRAAAFRWWRLSCRGHAGQRLSPGLSAPRPLDHARWIAAHGAPGL